MSTGVVRVLKGLEGCGMGAEKEGEMVGFCGRAMQSVGRLLDECADAE